MKILGITGGVGSGKSFVLSHLAKKKDVVVYEADQIAKEEQRLGRRCYDEILNEFGTEILMNTGEINREKLGGIVFGNQTMLMRLNEIVHPCVRERVMELVEYHNKQGTKLFVIEAAILLETNYQDICDEVWYIYCEQNKRIERLKTSRNYTKDTFARINENQLADDVFRARCNRIIDNSYDETHLKQCIDDKLKEFLGV